MNYHNQHYYGRPATGQPPNIISLQQDLFYRRHLIYHRPNAPNSYPQFYNNQSYGSTIPQRQNQPQNINYNSVGHHQSTLIGYQQFHNNQLQNRSMAPNDLHQLHQMVHNIPSQPQQTIPQIHPRSPRERNDIVEEPVDKKLFYNNPEEYMDLNELNISHNLVEGFVNIEKNLNSVIGNIGNNNRSKKLANIVEPRVNLHNNAETTDSFTIDSWAEVNVKEDLEEKPVVQNLDPIRNSAHIQYYTDATWTDFKLDIEENRINISSSSDDDNTKESNMTITGTNQDKEKNCTRNSNIPAQDSSKFKEDSVLKRSGEKTDPSELSEPKNIQNFTDGTWTDFKLDIEENRINISSSSDDGITKESNMSITGTNQDKEKNSTRNSNIPAQDSSKFKEDSVLKTSGEKTDPSELSEPKNIQNFTDGTWTDFKLDIEENRINISSSSDDDNTKESFKTIETSQEKEDTVQHYNASGKPNEDSMLRHCEEKTDANESSEPKNNISEENLEKYLSCIEGKFICELCGYVTDWKNNLRKHIISRHMSSQEIPWIYCAHCSYKGKTKEYLICHLKTNHGFYSKWYKCEHCEFKTKYKATFNHHKMLKHTAEENIKWYYCDQCLFKAKLKAGLLNHINTKHTGPDAGKWFRCEQCEFKTRNKRSLKKHLLKKHANEPKIKWLYCDKCSFRAKIEHKSSLNLHMQQHVAIVKKKINVINSRTSIVLDGKLTWKEIPVADTRLKAGEYFKCQQCQEVFTMPYLYQEHCKRKHSVSGTSLQNNEIIALD